MNSLITSTRRPDVVLHPNGCIEIAAHAARALRLGRGDVIDVAADGVGGELYLYVRHRAPTVGRHEVAVFPTHRRSHHFRCHSARLCRAVAAALATDTGDTLRLVCGEPADLPGLGRALPLIHHKHP